MIDTQLDCAEEMSFSQKESMADSVDRSRHVDKRNNLKEIINHKDCCFKYVNKLESIIIKYSREETINILFESKNFRRY